MSAPQCRRCWWAQGCSAGQQAEAHLGHDMGSILHDLQQGTHCCDVLPPLEPILQVLQSAGDIVAHRKQLLLQMAQL